MAHYEVVFESYANRGGVPEIPCFVEFERERFTRREWALILKRLFDLSMDWENANMRVNVYRNGDFCFSLKSETIEHGERIDTFVWVTGVLYRVMNIAE